MARPLESLPEGSEGDTAVYDRPTGGQTEGENAIWRKMIAIILGAAGLVIAPSAVIFNELRDTTNRNSERLGDVERKQVADHSFQAIAAVQQWCDAVIRELEREQASHRAYFIQQCPTVIPPVTSYTPPAPPWGPAAIK